MARLATIAALMFIAIAFWIVFFQSADEDASPDQRVRLQLAASDVLEMESLAQAAGRPLKRSPKISIVSTPDMRYQDTREDRLRKYMSQFDNEGFGPVRIFLKEAGPTAPYWRVDFAGCAPAMCEAVATTSEFFPSDKTEFESGRTHTALNEYIELERIFEGGTAYDVDLALFFDRDGLLLKARLSVYRDAESELQRFMNQLSSAGSFEGILVYEESVVLARADEG